MSWRRWKMALAVAIVTGLCSGGVVAFVDPTIKVRALVFILLYNIAQNVLLFLKDHPVEATTDDTQNINKPNV